MEKFTADCWEKQNHQHFHLQIISELLNTLGWANIWVTSNSRNGVIPKDTDRLGPLLCLQQGVLQGDGGVQDGRERRALGVDCGAHYGCVDHWPVGEPGNTRKSVFLTTDLRQNRPQNVYMWIIPFCTSVNFLFLSWKHIFRSFLLSHTAWIQSTPCLHVQFFWITTQYHTGLGKQW